MDSLSQALARKSSLEEELGRIERQIYLLEDRYLRQAHEVGNAVTGYTTVARGTAPKSTEASASDEDRVFSGSSCTGRHGVES
mmetsp:Transcript_19823/g.62949  ORF Transcript_19823/g.62949 Transcript_19823/m.62949 type:complete len:83 (+) Transcript_19823:1-249(+)